jgi:hypothetical protein
MAHSTSLAPIVDLAAERHGAFSRRQAADVGLERSAIRRLIDRGMLREPIPGVLVIAGAPTTWQQRLYAATLAARGEGLAVCRTAGRLLGVDGFGAREPEADDQLHVSVPRGARVTADGVRVSQTADSYGPDDRIVIDHIPCATLARTVCDLAGLGRAPMVRAFDHLQRRGHSPRWVEETALRLHVRGRAGIPAVLAEALRRLDGPEVHGSWFERLVEECLRSPRLPGLVRQHVIRDADDRFVCRTDFAFPWVRLAVEAHSRAFHTGPDAERIDERRESLAKLQGWEFEYVGWYHATRTPNEVRVYLEQLVDRRARDLGVRPPGR